MLISPLYGLYLNTRHVHIWDPHQEYLIYEIQKIQRWAARWALSDYNHYSSVTKISLMANTGKWKVYLFSRLTQLYKIRCHHIPAINLPPYYLAIVYQHNMQQDTPTSITICDWIYENCPYRQKIWNQIYCWLLNLHSCTT